MSGAIIVTGGAGGIGRAIAHRLHADGHTVVVADRDEAAANQAAQAIDCAAHALDIGGEASVIASVRAIAAQHGGLYGVVNNAGVHMQSLVVETSVEDWDRIHTINSRGTFLMCRETARIMAAQGDGRIVNITCGFQAYAATPSAETVREAAGRGPAK